ncbi:MAG: P-loop NTPase [Candidatus Methanoperedens sp.]|nr:P-loop NTPase [Candidatus Methanoperedens sp.]
MLFEHIIYSTSIAIIASMIHFKKTGRDYSWIIIASALAPDLDMFAGIIFRKFDIGILINGNPLKHGDFHNIAFLFLFAVLVGLLLKMTGMKFKDSFIFAGIGFGAHMLEDSLVYNPAYAFLWPFSMRLFGIGIIDYEPDWYRIANTVVLLAGIIIMILCATVRILYEGKPGLQRIIKTFALAGILLAITIPMFWFYQVDEGLKDEVRFGNFVDGWQFTNNTSWDPTVPHNGSHSARIEISGNESKKSGVWKSNKILVKPDTNYTFSSWGKIEGTGGINSPGVRVVQLDVNGKSMSTTNLIFSKGITTKWSDFFRKENSWAVQIGPNNNLDLEITGKQDTISNIVAPNNVWTHIAITFDDNTVKFYTNGSLADTKIQKSVPNPGSNSIYIGGNSLGTYLSGELDEIKIFNRNLKAEEINADYLNPVKPASDQPSDPVSYWSFNEGAGIVASDSSGNGNNVTLINGTTWTTGKNGKALEFDGTNDYAVKTSAIGVPGTPPFSILLWVNPKSLSNNWTQKQTIFRTGNNTSWVYVTADLRQGYGTFWFDDVGLFEEGTDRNIIPNSGFEMGVNHIIEISSLNKYGPIILIFVAAILVLSLRKYIPRKKFYKEENKEENIVPIIERRYHIIAIASGKGGVGKTTIAANLGIMLSKLHKKVTIIDMDLAMPNLEIITGWKSTPVGLIDVLEGRVGLDRVTYAGPEGIKIIPPGVMLEGYSKEETKQKIAKLLKNLPVDNDYIILDMPPGREAIDVLSGDDIGVLLVVNSNKPSILDAVNIKALLDKKNVKTLGVILNRYKRDPELIDEIEKTLDSKVVAVIPESKIVNDAYMNEECFAVTKEGCDASKELMEFAKEIVEAM